jgi:hypothetical protein
LLKLWLKAAGILGLLVALWKLTFSLLDFRRLLELILHVLLLLKLRLPILLHANSLVHWLEPLKLVSIVHSTDLLGKLLVLKLIWTNLIDLIKANLRLTRLLWNILSLSW